MGSLYTPHNLTSCFDTINLLGKLGWGLGGKMNTVKSIPTCHLTQVSYVHIEQNFKMVTAKLVTNTPPFSSLRVDNVEWGKKQR